MRLEIIKIDKVTCKGFVKTLSLMLLKVEGISEIEINYSDSELTFSMKSEIPREDIIKQLITSSSQNSKTATPAPEKKLCSNCVLKKLKTI